jgi:ATP-dependent helicase/nuclease subunit A
MRDRQLSLFGDAVAPATPVAVEAPADLSADEQSRRFAVDPRENVVLEASAGAGKTSVLVQRYVNLLQAGVDPVNILAITFTRKAAAEMRERILTELRRAAAQSQMDRARWRTLRDRLDEVAISTIDAFCLSLLREFPLEADLDPAFAMADETETLRLVDEALDRAVRICAAVAREDADVALVLAQLGVERARLGLQHLLERRLVAPAALARFLEAGPADLDAATVCARGAGGLLDALAGLPRGLEAFLTDGPVRHPRFAMLARDLRRLAAGPAPGPSEMRSLMDRMSGHFLTKEGEPRVRLSYKRERCASLEAYRRHQDEVGRVAANVRDAIHRFKRDLNVVLSRGVRTMFTIARAEYRAALDAHAVLDFPDLLSRALGLLQQMDEFARSRFRLESRYHHVLVDEFQDTSRAQWELVSLLIKAWGEGFGVGHEAKLPPSIFVVGDRKQSIYRFRDAEVAVLDEAAQFIRDLRPEGRPRRSIARSFRAVPELLAFVNALFGAIEKQSARADAFRYDERDRFPVDAAPFTTGDTPLGIAAAPDVERCAAAVADEIARLLETVDVRDRTTGVRRRARPADIGILFRSRESHREFERALEIRGIPAFVYKGLGFFDADEIKDASALVRFLADPSSNLHAAAFLRSGFARLSDEGLRRVAPGVAGALTDGSTTALDSLDDEDRSVMEMARGGVRRWLLLADRVPPAELVDIVLAETAYAYELRGPRAAQRYENLKKLRSVFRRIQNRGYATLRRLAEHIDRLSLGDESNAILDAIDAVNLMTVHAAKGLEFPIVFVVNLSRGAGGIPPPIRVVPSGVNDAPSVSIGGFVSETDEDERAREREETKRLLYVALTRARDRLYLSSVCKDRDPRAGRGSLGEVLPMSFQALFAAAAASNEERIEWTLEGAAAFSFRLCQKHDEGDGLAKGPVACGFSRTVKVHPERARDCFGPVAFEQTTRVTVTELLRPESPVASHVGEGDADEDRLAGTLVHRLLRDPEETQDLSDRAAACLTPAERATLEDPGRCVARATALYRAIRAQSDVLTLLAQGACHFEVPLAWRRHASPAQTDTIVRGTIDCLVIEPDGTATVLEFKTGSPEPWHQQQLDAYVAAARELFGDRQVRGRLVYAAEERRS